MAEETEDKEVSQIAGLVKGFVIDSPMAKGTKLAAVKSPTFGRFMTGQEGWEYLPEDVRREVYTQQIERGFEAKRAEYGLDAPGAIGEFAGRVIGDPTFYILGASKTVLGSATVMGGSVGGTVAIEQAADEGKVDPTSVAAWAAGGAILGAALHKVLGPTGAAANADVPVNVLDDAAAAIASEGKGFDPVTVSLKTTAAIRSAIPKMSESQAEQIVASVGASADEISQALTARFGDMAVNSPDNLYSMSLQKIAYADDADLLLSGTSRTELGIINDINFTYNLIRNEVPRAAISISAKDSPELIAKLKGFGVSNTPGSLMAYGVGSKFYRMSLDDQMKEAQELAKTWPKKFANYKNPAADELVDPAQGFMVDANGKLWANANGKLRPLTPKQQAFFEKLDKDPHVEGIRQALQENPEAIAGLVALGKNAGKSYGKGPLWGKMVEGDISYTFKMGDIAQDVSRAADSLDNIATAIASPTLDSRYIDIIMASHAGDIAKVQQMIGDLQAMGAGAILREGDSWLDKAWRSTMAKMGWAGGSGKWASTSARTLRRAGGPARILAEATQRANEMSDELVARAMTPLRTIRAKYNLTEEASRQYDHLIKEALENPGTAITNKYVKEVAAHFREVYDNTIHGFKEAGLLSADDAKKLLDKNAMKGYFSRIWNWEMLRSPEGMARVQTILAKAEFDADDIKQIAKALDMDEKNLVNELKSARFGTPVGKYTLNRQAWDKVFKMFEHDPLNPKSTYIHHARKIPDAIAKHLEEFQITNIDAVMQSFSQDTATQLGFAKYFGKDNELYETLMHGIKQSDPNLSFTASEMFLKDSRNPASFTRRKDWMASKGEAFMDKLRALQMYKLATATIDNLTGTALATYYFAGMKSGGGNAFTRATKALSTMYTGWTKGYKAMFGDEALRNTADMHAATLQKAILHTFGDSDRALTVTGRHFSNPFVEIMNNPTKFLEAVKFTATEDFNRISTFYAAESFTQGLVREYSELMAKNLPRGSRQAKRLELIKEDMVKLGLNPAEPLLQKGSITTAELEQARTYLINRTATRVSNRTNFGNKASDLPIMWQAGWVKPFTLFQSYSLRVGEFIYDNIINEAAKGNFAPAALALGTTIPMGDAKEFVRDMLFGDRYKPKEESFAWALAKRAALGIGLGIHYDVATKIRDNSPEKALIRLGGPMLGTAVNTLKLGNNAARSIGRGDLGISGLAGDVTEFALQESQLAGITKIGGVKQSTLEEIKARRKYETSEY